MFGTFFKSFYRIIGVTILSIPILFISILYNSKIHIDKNLTDSTSKAAIKISSNVFVWPLPGYTTISSYFGKRTSPTQGASSYHLGIDIPAKEGSKIYSVESGVIIFAGWSGGGGYCIILLLDKYPNISVSYCHISPNIIVNVGDYINKDTIIAYVGPKNVYGIPNNPYTDANRSSNKWRNYWEPFAFNDKRKW